MHSVKLYWCVKGSQWKPYFLRTFVKSNRVNNISSINLFFKLIDGKQIMGFVTSCSIYFFLYWFLFLIVKEKWIPFGSHNDNISNWMSFWNKLSNKVHHRIAAFYLYKICYIKLCDSETQHVYYFTSKNKYFSTWQFSSQSYTQKYESSSKIHWIERKDYWAHLWFIGTLHSGTNKL